ncbi:MAG: ABC transporter ATP-binding protein [Azoarcus sp.]|nr:ABC transporter ATP-binding protein [Azoarcus sp.]
MLRIDQLGKTLPTTPPRQLFASLCLQVAAGECVAIMGESGVGKSTLLNCVAGLEPVSAGSIRVGDAELVGLDDDALARLRRELFGFVFQAFHVLPHLSLLHNVAVPLWLQGVTGAEADRRALQMLDRVGLGDRASDWPRNLSGGELQRVAIARALVHRPAVVLADEPTGNLDPARASDILDLLLEQVREAGAAAILVTHSQAAANRAGRILELRADGLVPLATGAMR